MTTTNSVPACSPESSDIMQSFYRFARHRPWFEAHECRAPFHGAISEGWEVSMTFSDKIEQAYKDYWAATTREQEREAYASILANGGEDAYGFKAYEGMSHSEDVEVPLAVTEANLPVLVSAIEAEGYKVLVDPDTGDVKLQRQDDLSDGRNYSDGSAQR